MRKVMILIFGLILGHQAVADCSGGNCTGVTITRLYVIANGDTVISTSGDESQLSCSAGPSGYIRLTSNSTNYNAAYSLLLTSHISQTPIWIRTSDSGTCTVTYVVSDK